MVKKQVPPVVKKTRKFRLGGWGEQSRWGQPDEWPGRAAGQLCRSAGQAGWVAGWVGRGGRAGWSGVLVGQDGQACRACIRSCWRKRFVTTPRLSTLAYQQVSVVTSRIEWLLQVFQVETVLGCIPRWVNKNIPPVGQKIRLWYIKKTSLK